MAINIVHTKTESSNCTISLALRFFTIFEAKKGGGKVVNRTNCMCVQYVQTHINTHFGSHSSNT